MSRRWRCLVLLLFVYVGLDFGSPQMPGAFSFELTDSVEALRGDRPRDDALATEPGLAPPAAVAPRPAPSTGARPLAARPAVARWRRPAIRLRRRAAAPPPATEDD